MWALRRPTFCHARSKYSSPRPALIVISAWPVPYRAFLFTTSDTDVADVSGINVKRMDALLMLVPSVSILATLTIIGVTLVAATPVIPAVVVRMRTDSFSRRGQLDAQAAAPARVPAMPAPGPEPPQPEQAAPPPPAGMQVERVRLDDGRALLLFTWDKHA